jgi:hypothetical protein
MNFGDLPPEVRLEVHRYVCATKFIFWDRASRALAEVIACDRARHMAGNGKKLELMQRLRRDFEQSMIWGFYFVEQMNPVFESMISANTFDPPSSGRRTIQLPGRGCPILVNANGEISFSWLKCRGRNTCYGTSASVYYDTIDHWCRPLRKFIAPHQPLQISISPTSGIVVDYDPARGGIRERFLIPSCQILEALVSWPRKRTCDGCLLIINPY